MNVRNQSLPVIDGFGKPLAKIPHHHLLLGHQDQMHTLGRLKQVRQLLAGHLTPKLKTQDEYFVGDDTFLPVNTNIRIPTEHHA